MNASQPNTWAAFYHALHVEAEYLRQLLAKVEAAAPQPTQAQPSASAKRGQNEPRKKNAPAQGASLTNSGRAVDTAILSQIPPLSTPTRRRLDPRIGALKKLDAVEGRLAAARALGDDDRWSRYYLAWVRLHKVAFGSGVQNGKPF